MSQSGLSSQLIPAACLLDEQKDEKVCLENIELAAIDLASIAKKL